MSAPEHFKSFENLYGANNLAEGEDWLMQDRALNGDFKGVGVRMITAAPEVEGVMESISELKQRNIVFSMGHRSVHISQGDDIPQ